MNAPRFLAVISVSKNFIRTARNKHWNPGPKEYWNRGIPNYDWKRGRAKKIMIPKEYISLVEDYKNQNPENLTPDERRTMFKEKGVAPAREWNEETIFLSASGAIFDPFVPPEGDGKASLLSVERSKQETAKITSKGRSMMALKKIRTFLEYFDPGSFGQEALEIYKKAHQCLIDRDNEGIFDYVTEKCYPEMTRYTDLKTLRWKFIKSIEVPRVVHVRYVDGQDVGSQFGQVTVRLHTAQTLAIYDQFGRLMYGDEAVVKNVLEYVVFENHVANIYGKWRIHGKIIPSWMPPRTPIPQTFVQPSIATEPESVDPESPKTNETPSTESDKLATA